MLPATLILALLMAVASLAGILLPEIYARETAEWAGQAIGQDWFDLLVAVPALVVCALGARRGSLRWRLALGGALAFTVYTFVLYAFAVQFNRMFLIYCAILGLSSYLLAAIALGLTRSAAPLRYRPRAPVRRAGTFLIAIAVVFAAAWLGETIPAILHGHVPRTVARAGLVTNPVHVLDLSIVLPAHLLVGLSLLRGRPLAAALAPLILAFGVLMSASIAAMMLVMHLRGLPAELPVAAALAGVALVSGALLLSLLSSLDDRPGVSSPSAAERGPW